MAVGFARGVNQDGEDFFRINLTDGNGDLVLGDGDLGE